MSWENILKRDPLKDNGKKILNYSMQAHTYMKRVDELFEIIGQDTKFTSSEVKNTKGRANTIATSITDMQIDPQGIALFYVNTVIPEIKKEFDYLRAINESLISMGMPEHLLTHNLPKPIDFDKMKRELEMFVDDEGDLT